MRYLFYLLLLFFYSFLYGESNPIPVAQIKIEIGARQIEEVFYGFAEGDVLIFSFEEANGKTVRDIQITEMPNNLRFSDLNKNKLEDIRINVHSNSIYSFKLYNSALGRRSCRLIINRIPKSEDLVRFNTNWEWKDIFDTIYTPYTEDSLIGYDTILTPYTKKELVRIDTSYYEIKSSETSTRLRSRSHTSCFSNPASCTKNITVLSYPENTEYLIVWIGVGQEAKKEYDNLTRQLSKTIINSGLAHLTGGVGLLASSFVNKSVDAYLDNIKPSKSIIDIFFTNKENANFWYNDMDNRINTFEGLSFKNKSNFKHTIRKKDLPKKRMYLCMKNNATRTGVDVSMNVVAVTFEKIYEDKRYVRREIKPKYTKVNKTKVTVKKSKVRVNAG